MLQGKSIYCGFRDQVNNTFQVWLVLQLKRKYNRNFRFTPGIFLKGYDSVITADITNLLHLGTMGPCIEQFYLVFLYSLTSCISRVPQLRGSTHQNLILRTTNQPTKMAAESPTSTQGTKVLEMVKSKEEELRIEKQERGKRKKTTKKKEQ